MAIAERLFGGLPQVLHEENTEEEEKSVRMRTLHGHYAFLHFRFDRLTTHRSCTARGLGDASGGWTRTNRFASGASFRLILGCRKSGWFLNRIKL